MPIALHDYVSRDMMIEILCRAGEGRIDWLETEAGFDCQTYGIPNYLQSQIKVTDWQILERKLSNLLHETTASRLAQVAEFYCVITSHQ